MESLATDLNVTVPQASEPDPSCPTQQMKSSHTGTEKSAHNCFDSTGNRHNYEQHMTPIVTPGPTSNVTI